MPADTAKTGWRRKPSAMNSAAVSAENGAFMKNGRGEDVPHDPAMQARKWGAAPVKKIK